MKTLELQIWTGVHCTAVKTDSKPRAAHHAPRYTFLSRIQDVTSKVGLDGGEIKKQKQKQTQLLLLKEPRIFLIKRPAALDRFLPTHNRNAFFLHLSIPSKAIYDVRATAD
jgi:hypothetical protein